MKFLSNIILFISVHFQVIKCCSDLFKYYSDIYGVHGKIVLHNVPLQPSIRFEIHLSIAARIGRDNVGILNLVNRDVYNDLKNGRDLIYNYYPPMGTDNILPVVTGIYLNNQQLCYGPPATGSYISTLSLYNTYTLGINVPYQSYNPDPSQNIVPVQNQVYNPPIQQIPQETTIFYRPPPIKTRRPVVTVAPITYKKPTTIENRNILVNQKISEVCGKRVEQSEIVSFIVGGSEAKKNEFPWLCAFYYKTMGFICGGTLVSTKIVITAAHCVQDKQTVEIRKASDSTFYIGKYSLNALNEVGYIDSGVTSFHINPQWNPNDRRYDGDLAIAVLSRTVEFADNIRPICIWPQSNSHTDLVGKRGLIAGWGITETGSLSEKPMFLSLPVVDDAECLRSKPAFAEITSKSNFCVGDKTGRAPCQGDSGGAFAFKSGDRFYLRGIVSAGARKDDYSCDTSQYVLFTDAAKYSTWINSYIDTYG
ncbi:hypothetical protein PVAND_010994 [Polypedilum vanderplanki]|uniref:Peptidase S1 domain-containing protein n=1 Tax=Polypedilum vanderplanki TaxID=319348 RepID=A0A9J6CI81_POLVA|nr:hypothetical protein PVAND_010994 [Polypedilum vanderplanki]